MTIPYNEKCSRRKYSNDISKYCRKIICGNIKVGQVSK